jgi:flagella basal body P-ring formation protein FlgA
MAQRRRLVAAALGALAVVVAGLGSAPALAESEKLPVPAITIYPGDLISPGMITLGDFVPGTADRLAVVGSAAELAGKVARRTLLPGRLIARTSVSEPMLVQKGAIIAAVYRQGELTITASVLALQSGGLNDVIQVRNIDSGKVIVGAVQADGTVGLGGVAGQ